MKRLGAAALGAVILQGVLGGSDRALLPAGGDFDRARGARRDLLLHDRRHRALHVAGAG